jgi:hypothetical protein
MNHPRTQVERLCLPDIYRCKKGSKRPRQTAYSEETDEQAQALVYSDDDSSSTTSSSNDSSSDAEESFRSLNSLRAPRARGWRVLRRHLRKGTLLLNINGGMELSYHSQKSLRQAMVNEFQEGLHFSIPFCLMTIVIYLALAVAMYSCVLEPTWTVIDSCYFAVVTFTTTGYGDLVVSNEQRPIQCRWNMAAVVFLIFSSSLVADGSPQTLHLRYLLLSLRWPESHSWELPWVYWETK